MIPIEKVSFFNRNDLLPVAEEVFTSQRKRIKNFISNADVQHIGSTAIPNSLTKGDVDIQVRISFTVFLPAVDALFNMYEINDGSIKTSEFRAFKDDSLSLPLGVQLTVFDSAFDFFWRLRDVLLQNDRDRIEYDQLKEKFEGKAMDVYQEAKSDFFNTIKQTPEYKRLKSYPAK